MIPTLLGCPACWPVVQAAIFDGTFLHNLALTAAPAAALLPVGLGAQRWTIWLLRRSER
jgi:hypothetical protein